MGGEGTDTLDLSDVDADIAVNLQDGTANSSETGDDIISGFENLVTGSGDDTVTGSAADDTISTGEGADTIDGGDGIDLIDGGAGNDVISDGAGSDMVLAGAGDDTVIAGSGNDSMDGGEGTDTLDMSNASSDAVVDLNAGTATSSETGNDQISNFENVTTGAGDDQITGSSANNNINAGAGNDTIDGGAGDDTVAGGLGADTFVFADSTDDDVVSDFTVGEDKISIDDLGLESWSDLLPLLGENGNGDAVLSLPAGGTVTLIGVGLSDLSADDFTNITDGATPFDDNLEGTDEDDVIDAWPVMTPLPVARVMTRFWAMTVRTLLMVVPAMTALMAVRVTTP